jgi:hypothetical protein
MSDARMYSTRVRMTRQGLALKTVLAIVGVIFLALAYPMVVFIRQDPALSMMLSLYVTLGVFLLLAIRNPSAHRSIISFTAWSQLGSRSSYGDTGNAQHGSSRRADRRGRSLGDRCRANCSYSCEAICRRAVDLHRPPHKKCGSALASMHVNQSEDRR